MRIVTGAVRHEDAPPSAPCYLARLETLPVNNVHDHVLGADVAALSTGSRGSQVAPLMDCRQRSALPTALDAPEHDGGEDLHEAVDGPKQAIAGSR
jgi:hypothetical protein